MRLEDRVAIVTGAGRGIGKAIAKKFVEEGAVSIITDINLELAKGSAAEIESEYNSKCLGYKMDVTQEDQINIVFDEVLKQFGRIDILVNNAGISQPRGDFENFTWDDWMRIIEVNLGGTVRCSRVVVSTMKKQKAGKIINIASLAGETGGIAVAPGYSASKAAVSCLTKTLAKNCAAFNINVNAVAPGFIVTELSANLEHDVKLVPLGRLGYPEDVADLVLFLASEESRYITGATIDVNGGIYMK